MGSKIPITVPAIDKEMIESSMYALQNEKLVMGESVHKFEEELAAYFGVKHAVTVNSGSSALTMVFQAFGIKLGDKIAAPSATFIATVNGPCLLGAVPIFADIDPDTYCVDPRIFETISNNKVDGLKAVIPVHLYGFPADMKSIVEIAKERKMIVIEDCAQAHGAMIDGKKLSSFGDAAILSFYPTKNMTVGGDGGAVLTNDDIIADVVGKLRDVGRIGKYKHDMMGYTLRLNSVNCAIGRIQLKRLDGWNKRRREIASIYDTRLSSIQNHVKTPSAPDGHRVPVYHLYALRTLHNTRNILGAWLTRNNVEVLIHYPIPVHMQPAYSSYADGLKLPVTDEWARSILSLPIHPSLKDEQIHHICDLIIKFYEEQMYNQPELRARGEEWYAKLI